MIGYLWRFSQEGWETPADGSLSREEGSRISPARLATLEGVMQVSSWLATLPGLVLIAWILSSLALPMYRPRAFLDSTAHGSLTHLRVTVEFALMGPLSMLLMVFGLCFFWFGVTHARGASRRKLAERTVFLSGKVLPLVLGIAGSFAWATGLGKASGHIPWLFWLAAGTSVLVSIGVNLWVAVRGGQQAKLAAAEVKIRKDLAGRQVVVSLPGSVPPSMVFVIPPKYPFSSYANPAEFAFGWYPAHRGYWFPSYASGERECQEYLERLEASVSDSDQPIYVFNDGPPISVHVCRERTETRVESLEGSLNWKIVENEAIAAGPFERAFRVILAEGMMAGRPAFSVFGRPRRHATRNWKADGWRVHVIGESECLALELSVEIKRRESVGFYQSRLQEMLEAATVESVRPEQR